MNTKSLILGVSAASALLSTPAVMAQSAVSLPVGYATTTLSNQFNFVAPNFANPIAFSGSVSSDLAGTFTAGAFDAGTVHPAFYVEIASGDNEGARADIASNTSGVLVLDDDGGTFAALLGGGTDVVIRKHVTVADAFGADTADLLIDPGAGAGAADNVLFFNDGGFETIFFLQGLAGGGWTSSDAANTDAANTPIDPGAGVVVTDNNGDNDELTFVGHVKATKTLIPLTQGFNLVGLPVAVPENVSTIFGPNAETLTGGAGAGAADTILRFNGAGFDTPIFFQTGLAGSSYTEDPEIGFSESFFVQIQDNNPATTVEIDQFEE